MRTSANVGPSARLAVEHWGKREYKQADALLRDIANRSKDSSDLSDLMWVILTTGMANRDTRFSLDDREEIELRTLEQVQRKLTHYRGGNFAAWVRQIARNEGSQLVRSRERRNDREERAESHRVRRSLRFSTLLARRHDVRSAFHLLDQEDRELLSAWYDNDENLAAAARQLDIAPSTARDRFGRATAALRRALESEAYRDE
jgi:DNA-directed RNA polymerase specialized sigma24 family protein